MTEENTTEKNDTKDKGLESVEKEAPVEFAPLDLSTPTITTDKVEESSEEDDDDDDKKKKARKQFKSKKKHVARGRAYIKATYNNTIVTFTDQRGNVLAQSSAGQCGFKGPKKSTPYAAGMIVRNVAEKVQDTGLKDLDVFVKGIGSGREGAIRALNAQGFNMLSIKDETPTPHNGCRPKKPRRV